MNGCVDTMDQKSFDYCVITFELPPKNGLEKHICVPVSWIRSTDGESFDLTGSRSVEVAYPLETANLTIIRVKEREDPDPRWGNYKATVDLIGNYANAIEWINYMKCKKIVDDFHLKKNHQYLNTREETSKMDQKSFDYCVITFELPPKNGLEKHICVPVSWIRSTDGESFDLTGSRYVQVAYPLEAANLTIIRVKNRKDPDPGWGKYKATVDLIGNYADAIEWINYMKCKKIVDDFHLKKNHQYLITREETSTEQNQSLDQQVTLPSQICEALLNVKVEPEELVESEKLEDDGSSSPNQIHSNDNEKELRLSEESEDDGSSSPNQIHSNDNEKQSMMATLLSEVVKNLLNEIKKAKLGQYRFEFDEIRYIRESDKLIVDRVSKLTVKINNEDNVNNADDTTAWIKREAISPIDTRWTPQVQATREVLQSSPLGQTVTPANINIFTPGRPQSPRKQNSQTHSVTATSNSSTAIASIRKILKRSWDSTSGGIGAKIQEYMSSTHCSQPQTLGPAPSCSPNLQAGDRNNQHMRPNSASNITASHSNTAHKHPREVIRKLELQHTVNTADNAPFKKNYRGHKKNRRSSIIELD